MQPVNIIDMFAQAAYDVDHRKLSGLTADTVISSLGMDSVAVMELIAYFEEKLDVRIPDEDLGRVRTLGDLREAIARLLPDGMLAPFPSAASSAQSKAGGQEG